MKYAGYIYLVIVGGIGSISTTFFPERYVEFHFVLQCLAVLLFLLLSERKIDVRAMLTRIYLLVFLEGILVGGVNVLFDRNSLYHYCIYSIIYLMGFIGLIVGQSMARQLTKERLLSVLATIGLAESLYLIPRIFGLGIATRSSMGFSFFAPLLFLRKAVTTIDTIQFVATGVTLASVYLLSGLRSVLITGLIMCAWMFWLRPIRFSVIRTSAIALLAGIAFTSLPTESQIRQSVENSVTVVLTRMNQTLFSESGFRLDPAEGRDEEVSAAYDNFLSLATPLDHIFGRGFGFSYPSYEDGAIMAHLHITPVAYYFRNGILGILLYFWIIGLSVTFFLRVLRAVDLIFSCIGVVDLGYV